MITARIIGREFGAVTQEESKGNKNILVTQSDYTEKAVGLMRDRRHR